MTTLDLQIIGSEEDLVEAADLLKERGVHTERTTLLLNAAAVQSIYS